MNATPESHLATMPVAAASLGIRAGDRVPFRRTTEAEAGDIILCSVYGAWKIVLVRRKAASEYYVSNPRARREMRMSPAEGFMVHGVILPAGLGTSEPIWVKVRDASMEPRVLRGEVLRVEPRRCSPFLLDGRLVALRTAFSDQPVVGVLRAAGRGCWLERLNAPPLVLGMNFTVEGVVSRG